MRRYARCSPATRYRSTDYPNNQQPPTDMDLKARVLEGELMDAPDLEARPHIQALDDLQRVNRFSGTAHVVARAILKHCRSTSYHPKRDRRLSILDLACGGGDVTLGVSQTLLAAGLDVDIQGWDRSSTAVQLANQRSDALFAACARRPKTPVHFHIHDVDDLNGEKSFDIVMCTLFLHHLDREEAVRCLSKMYCVAGELVLVDDLRRTWTGYRLAQLGCRLLARSPIVHVDGPLSVRAAFTENELGALCRDARLPTPVFTRHWPQRFLMRVNRSN